MKWLKFVGAAVVLACVVGCAGSTEVKSDAKSGGAVDTGKVNTAMDESQKHMSPDMQKMMDAKGMGKMDSSKMQRPGAGGPVPGGGAGPGGAAPGGAAPGGAAPGGAAPGGAAPGGAAPAEAPKP